MTILSKSNIIAFIPSKNLNDSKNFYEGKIGLTLENSDEIALEYKINKITLRVTHVTAFTPASYTLFGWEVNDIESTVNELIVQGIKFEKFDGFSQSVSGICTFPGGSRVA